MAQLLMSTDLDSRPQVFAELVRGSVGEAEALPFYVFNTPLEWIFVPAVLLVTWSNRRSRTLVLAIVAPWLVHRVWTYAYFVPRISDLSVGDPATPLTADQVTVARNWVNLSWIRSLTDLSTTTLVVATIFIHGVDKHSGDRAAPRIAPAGNPVTSTPGSA